jgi:hypothetical protein
MMMVKHVDANQRTADSGSLSNFCDPATIATVEPTIAPTEKEITACDDIDE